MQYAFVIQFSPVCSGVETFVGKIEHVRSGRAIHFNGLHEFMIFVLQNLDAEHSAAEQHDTEGHGPLAPENDNTSG
jgi:hypothetical protein